MKITYKLTLFQLSALKKPLSTSESFHSIFPSFKQKCKGSLHASTQYTFGNLTNTARSDISHMKESNETATNTDENMIAYMHQNGFKYRKVSCLTRTNRITSYVPNITQFIEVHFL